MVKQRIIELAKIAGIMIGAVSTAFASFFFLDSRHAHNTKVDRIHTELQLRGNSQYLETRKIIIDADIRRISDVITMYRNKQLINGVLDAADASRLESLEREVERTMQDRSRIIETIEAMRLETNRIINN